MLNNGHPFYDNPSNYFFRKLNGMPTGEPLDSYNYLFTNLWVNSYPQVRFADPLIPEFPSLFPKDQLNKGEYFTWFLLYHNELDFLVYLFLLKM